MKKRITKQTRGYVKLLTIAFAIIISIVHNTHAQVTINAPALAVTACPSFPTSPQTLGNIVITETSANDISGSGTLILSTPSTFQFTGVGSASVTGTDITGISLTHTGNSTITLTFTVNNTIQLDTIVLSGIQIRGIFSATPASDIVRTGGTSIINGDTIGSIHAVVTSTDAPTLNSSLTPPAICSGSIFNYSPTSTVTGTTFNWTRAAVSGISNTSGAGSNDPSEILNDTLSTPVNTTYIYTLAANGCTNPATFSVSTTVNPTPLLTSTLTPSAICSGTSFSYTPASSTSGTAFSWTRASVTGISNTSASGTDNPNEILTDTTTAPVNTIYSYSLIANGCTNPTSYNVTVTVYPAPSILFVLNDTICNADTIIIPLSNTVNSTYSWFAFNNANTDGESITNQTNDTIFNVITNNAQTIETVNYAIIPTALGNSCIGDTTFFSVVVIPTVTVNPINEYVASFSIELSIPLSSNIPSVFNWNSTTNSFVSGESSIPVTSDTIIQMLLNNDTLMQTVEYYVTPTSLINGCVGIIDTFKVILNANNLMTSTDSIYVCSGSSVYLTLTSQRLSTYKWIAAENINATGESTTLQVNDTITDILYNTTDTIQIINYTATPTSISSSLDGTPQNVTVILQPRLSLITNNISSFCPGTTNGIGGTPTQNCTYLWTPGTLLNDSTINNPFHTAINNTNTPFTIEYTVLISDTISTCQASDSTSITIYPQPNLVINHPSAVCFPNSLNLTDTLITMGSTNGNIFSYWTNSSATDTLQSPNAITASDTNFIKLTGIGGCYDIDSVITVVNRLPLSDAGIDIAICSGTIDSIGSIANPAYTYSWNTNAGISDSTLSKPAVTKMNNTLVPLSVNYSVTTTITATGCQSMDTILVTINPQPVLVVNHPSPVCAPGIIILTDTAITAGSSMGGIFSYWKDLAATDTLTSTTLTVSDTNFIRLTAQGGCTDIDSVITIVNNTPVSNAGLDQNVCSGNNAIIGASPVAGYTYEWHPGTGLNDSTLSNPLSAIVNNTTVPISTLYVLTSTDPITGCYSLDTVTVTVNPQPVLVVNNPVVGCLPGSIDLTVASVTQGSTNGGIFTYWTNITATDTLQSPNSIAVNDTNFIKITAIGGCTDLDSVITAVYASPVSNAGIDLNLCAGVIDTIGSTAVSGYTYAWSPGIGLSDSTISNPFTSSVNATNNPIATNYTLITTDSTTGCQTADSVMVTINPAAILIITNPPSSCASDTIDLTDSSIIDGSSTGTYSYWMDAGATDTLTSPDAITVSNTYYVKLTAIGGCSDLDSVTVIVNPLPLVSFTGLNYSNCYNSSPQPLTGFPSGGVFSGNGVSGNTFTASIAGVGVQPVTYTYTDTNGCSRSASQFIQILPVSNVLPKTCMVTVDEVSNHNIVYWNKADYTNVDSFIVYREINSGDYKKVGAVNRISGLFIDTTQQLYFPNTGNPNTASYRYKLQIRDTCGDFSALSTFHKTIYLSHNGGTFNFTHYEIENESVPLTGLTSYVLMRDGNNTGNWDVVGSSFGSTLTITDASYSSYPNGKWRIETLWNISCNGTPPVNSTFSNIITDTTTVDGINDVTGFSIPVSIYPNPYSQNTTIHYSLHSSAEVKLEVYNTLGETLETLVNANQNPGEYKYGFSAKALGYSAGVYFVKISVNNKYRVMRIVETE